MRTRISHWSCGKTCHCTGNRFRLHCKTFAAATGSGCIWIIEKESFAFEPPGKFQGGVEEVKEALQICDHFYAIVFKNLVVGLGLVVKIHFISQTGASPTGDTHPDKVFVINMFFIPELLDFGFGAVSYEKHDVMVSAESINKNLEVQALTEAENRLNAQLLQSLRRYHSFACNR